MRHYAMIARKYRLYAQELRAIADDEDGAAVTNASKLRSIACDYEQMAVSIETVAASREKLERL